MAGIVSKSYCEAIFALAQEEKKVDIFKEQLVMVNDSVQNDAEYRAVMCHPKISKENKKEVLETVYGKEIDHILLNFLKLLVDKGRFNSIRDITREYVKSYNELNRIQVVYVKSAVPLKEAETEKLKMTLEKKLQKKVNLEVSEDVDLIAGIRIKINDQIIDNSAKGRLERLKAAVLNGTELNA